MVMTGTTLIVVLTLLLILTMLAAWKLTDNMVDKTTAFILSICIGVVVGTIGSRLLINYLGNDKPPVLYQHSTEGGEHGDVL